MSYSFIQLSAKCSQFILFFIFSILPLQLAAANGVDKLDEIIVTSKSDQRLSDLLPTTHLFTAADIEQIQAKDVTSLLQQVAGINITDTGGRGSTTGVFLRGSSIGQTIVLIDGVRVGSATLGSAALNSYPLEAIQRIEVVKGPLSGLYGADAVGGVIQLFTASETVAKDGFGGSVNAVLGSNSLREYGVSLQGGSEQNNLYFSAQTEDSQGIDRTSIKSGGNDDIDGFEQTSFSLGGRAQISDRTAARLAVIYSDNDVEFDNTFGDDSGFFTETKTLSSALTVDSQLNSSMRWLTTLGHNEDESITPAFASEFVTDRNSLSSELRYTLNDQSTLTLGLDYYEEDVEAATDFPVTDRDNKGVYALYQARLGAWGFVGNARYDDNSAYGSDSNGSLAIDYRFNDSLRAVLSYGTAFVAPSFNSLYFPFFGNPDLLPEESSSYELSLRGQANKLNWRVSAYRNEIDNLFSFDPATFLAANIGQADIEGIEAELALNVSGWQLAASIDVLSAKDSNTGIELDDRAQQSIALSAMKSWQKFDLRVALHGEKARFDNRGTELASYALFDLNATYRLTDRWSLHATVDNLFDKDYTLNLIGPSDRYLTEGRQSRLKIRYKF